MTAETKIKTTSVADDTALRTLEISLGKRKIVTPSKALDAKIIKVKNSPTFDGGELNEVATSFTPLKIQSILENQAKSRDVNREIAKLSANTSNLPSAAFIEFKTKEPLLPDEKEISVLTNFAYTYSDITPIPSVPKYAHKLARDNLDNFQTYLKNAITSIEEWNHKPIMGYIPFVAQLFVDKILDIYLDHGINSFYLDFNTKGMTDLAAITAIKKKMGREGYGENHFIHIINMNYDKANKEAAYLPARDFLGFGMGFDSLGDTHRGRAMRIEGPPKKILPEEKKVRVFDRNGYGYYKIDVKSLSEDTTPYPLDAMYTRDQILDESSGDGKIRMIRQVNFREQQRECSNLQILSKENEDTFGYFNSKTCLDEEDKKRLKNIVSQIR